MANTPKKIIKVEPSKDYKKPLYACALATAIAASSLALTGCKDPFSSIDSYFDGLLVADIPASNSTSGHKQDADATLASDIPTDGPDETDETT